ncbi:hypothetical protein FRC12_012857 [Ceratobasidium sp. 428]|nr:hypothetical protein FRC12_012857 [Ceratobasidium sp. 428]
MSHRPRKRVKSVAEPTPALEPTLATTQPAVDTPAAPTPSHEPALNDPLVAQLVRNVHRMVETLQRTAVMASKIEPHTPRHTFTIVALLTRKSIIDSIDILDQCIDASQPGRTSADSAQGSGGSESLQSLQSL